jgi:hypothetical protein
MYERFLILANPNAVGGRVRIVEGIILEALWWCGVR